MEASCLLSTCLHLPIEGIDQIALTINLLYGHVVLLQDSISAESVVIYASEMDATILFS